MKIYINAILPLLVLLSCKLSVGPDESQAPTEIKQKSPYIQKPMDGEKLIVSTCMVTNTGLYGYLGKGSALFDYSNCVRGYRIQVFNNDELVSTSYCPQHELQKYLEIIKYEMSIKDSVITGSNLIIK